MYDPMVLMHFWSHDFTLHSFTSDNGVIIVSQYEEIHKNYFLMIMDSMEVLNTLHLPSIVSQMIDTFVVIFDQILTD